MSNEIRLNLSVQVKKGNFVYHSQPTVFTADMDNDPRGLTPGQVRVSDEGTDISFSGLTSPGWCFFRNLDDTNYIQLGVWNPDQSEFYPLFRLYPGEHFVAPIDPEINEEYAGTGTGTTGQTNTFRALAENGPVNMEVYCLER